MWEAPAQNNTNKNSRILTLKVPIAKMKYSTSRFNNTFKIGRKRIRESNREIEWWKIQRREGYNG